MHSKSLVGPGVKETVQLMKPRKTPEDFEFIQISTPAVADGFAYSRASGTLLLPGTGVGAEHDLAADLLQPL
jgi:hypothetical protein